MSLSAIRNGICATLTACGPYSASDVSTCDAGILDGVSGCGVLLMPGTTAFDPDRFGINYARGYIAAWGVDGLVYIKDTGDPTGLKARVWQAPDDLFNTISKDSSLQSALGPNGTARLTRWQYVGGGEDVAGQFWEVIRFTIEAVEIN